MSVSIKVDQGGKPAGVAGQAREDIDVGTSVTLSAVGGPWAGQQWTVLHRPVEVRTNSRATAVLGSPTATTTSLTPIDVRGTYLVQLAVDSGSGVGATAADVARITFYAGIPGDKVRGAPNADPRLLPRRLPGAGERAEHNAPDAIDPGGNPDGWAEEFYRWERVWQDMWEGKAWAAGRVDLTGAGATLVRGYNVASVVRSAQGVVLVTFTVALPDASYAVLGTARSVGGSVTSSSELAASCVIERGDVGGALVDAPFNFRVEARRVSWGLGPWGLTPWGFGGGEGGELALLSATAVRENLVRLAFSAPVRLLGDLAPRDAGHVRKYAFTANAGTTGLDGEPARAVLPALVELALVANAGGALVDVWTDRPLSPYPALYTVAVTEIFGAGGELLAIGGGFAAFDGMRAALVPPIVDRTVVGIDFANPQSPALVADDRAPTVGSFAADATGDYAVDQGLVSYRKRVMRRLFTQKGRFAHLRDYGVDVLGLAKQIAKPSVRARFIADAEEQIRQEPETAQVQVALHQVGPGTFELQVRARTRFGQVVEQAERLVVGGG